MTSLFKVTVGLKGMDSIKNWLNEFPSKVQNRIFRAAGRKAAKLISDRAKQLTPKDKRKDRALAAGPSPKRNVKPWHIRDKHTFAQRIYRKSGNTLMVIGYQSSTAPHGHLVEFGNPKTRPRMTKTAPVYVKVREGFLKKRRLETTKSGAIRTVWEKQERIVKRQTKSKRKLNAVGPSISRGNMPPFHPLTRAVNEVGPSSLKIIEAEIKAGLERIAKE